MTRARTNADQAHTESVESIPHIIPGVLYPAVAGKLLDGSTSHSGNYGTAQADGYSYYYTDIKGSKPIKDPRIGAHFGSQRYRTSSLQKLEQETATHGMSVYSVDGREWMRVVDAGSNTIGPSNTDDGLHIYNVSTPVIGSFFEVVGYFNDVNISQSINTNADYFKVILDGGTAEDTDLAVSANSPIKGRYVPCGSLINLTFDSTPSLGIHTLRFSMYSASYYLNMFGIELIAQDTSSTANKSKIQIPSQNVVSYGKKFTVSGTPHYDPFNGFTNSSDLHSAYVDTATSLGLSSAPGSSASWAISSTNNIRPYNGMRVVKWVDSSGTIKTSVTAMPPNAQNIKTTASNEITTPSATNTTTTPNMSDDAVDHSLAEVAKTYHFREFGNGAANGGANATHADASMLTSTSDDIAYVMDDGLTSLTGDDVQRGGSAECIHGYTDGDGMYITFIGTGLTLMNDADGAGTYHIVQNLPYGTHIYKHYRDANATPDGTIDGIALADIVGNTYSEWVDVTFHQPKKPPIPEDCVVLADYMLMADWVPQTSGTLGHISKGVRFSSGSRDSFYDGSWTGVNTTDTNYLGGWYIHTSNGGDAGDKNSIPAFSTNVALMAYGLDSRYRSFKIDGGSNIAIGDRTSVPSSSGAVGSIQYVTASQVLGLHTYEQYGTGTSYGFATGWEIVSPIHTSSHYQTFETPYLHELVGGDRNMEQTNLVVTSDGKTWDEVTRDTSYLGPSTQLSCTMDNAHVSSGNPVIFDEFRGENSSRPCFNKNIAIAYDRMIILENGIYQVDLEFYNNQPDAVVYITKNSTSANVLYGTLLRADSSDDTTYGRLIWEMKRGDYIYVKVDGGGSNTFHGTNSGMQQYNITKIN